MKITSLEIKNYKQFADLTLDLTYPKGHDKEGEPLDKICIIGQSGTGKTNLLEMIREKLYSTDVKTIFIEDENSNSEKIYFSSVEKYSNQVLNNKKKKMSSYDKNLLEELEDEKKRLVFEELKAIPPDSNKSYGLEKFEIIANSLSEFYQESAVSKKYQLINSAIREIKDKYETEIITNYNNDIIELDENVWKLLEETIKNYDIKRLKYRDRLSNKLLNISDYSKEDFKREIKEWESENENILENISDKLNSILIRFNLKLHKIDKNQSNYNDLTIEDLSNGNIIEYNNLSTGTKNLIATFIPLKIHNPQDSIILIDEPENSFYPDIQRELTDLYMNVGENNQLIMATHSPLIASSFEPWEVVELKFDKNNQIYRELYYKGENHVDNYTLDPRMLTWTSILVDIFDLKEDSFSLREKKLMEYGMLKAEIKAMEKGEDRDEKIKKFKKLSALLGLQN